MSARLKEPAYHMWECDGGHIVVSEPNQGVAQAYKRRGHDLLFLADLWVPPEARGHGAAQALMRAATRWATRTRTDLWLYAEPFGPPPRMDDHSLVAFYTQYGFVQVALRSKIRQMVRRA